MERWRDLDFARAYDVGRSMVSEVDVQCGQDPCDYNLVVGCRSRGHEQDALDQLVALPVVGEGAHHVHRVSRERERHSHNLPPRRGSEQSAMGQRSATWGQTWYPLHAPRVQTAHRFTPRVEAALPGAAPAPSPFPEE